MKKLILISCLFLLIGCDFTEPKGKCDGIVKVIPSKATFSSNGDSIILEVKDNSWKIADISINGTPSYELPKSMQFKYKSPDFHENIFILLEKRDKNHLFIKMKENTSKEKRVLAVDLQSGNCFSDEIIITQEAGN